MAQLPNLGRLALRPSVVPTGVVGQGKKQKTYNPEQDLKALWVWIINEVNKFESQNSADFFSALISALNTAHPGLITPLPDLRVNGTVLGLPTRQANMQRAREVILATYRAVTQKRKRDGASILAWPKKAKAAPDASQLERQRNAMQSVRMDDDREDGQDGHFADATNFEDPPPPPPNPQDESFDDAQRRQDRIRKWPPELARLVVKRDPDGRRCCATDS